MPPRGELLVKVIEVATMAYKRKVIEEIYLQLEAFCGHFAENG